MLKMPSFLRGLQVVFAVVWFYVCAEFTNSFPPSFFLRIALAAAGNSTSKGNGGQHTAYLGFPKPRRLVLR